MATTTTRLGLRKPDPDPVTGDFVDAQFDINDNMDNLDGKMPFLVCTSGTRPGSPYQGQQIFETDTGNCLFYNGTGWKRLLSEGGGNYPTFIQVERSSDTNGTFSNFKTGDSQSKWFIQIDGKQWWGSGAASHDTNLYRVAANQLKTDDDFLVGGLLIPSVGYMFKERVLFTASGTFTKASYTGLRAVMVYCQSGGNAGGGATATGASQTSAGGGGAGGGGAVSFLLAAALGANETVTVGAGGTGVSGAAGNQGNNSSFGALVIADSGNSLSVGGTTGAAAGTPSACDGGHPEFSGTGQLLIPGQPGGFGFRGGTAGAGGGHGGGSGMFGGGASGVGTASSGATGRAGNVYGGGGSGAANGPSQGARLGGAGATGVVIVDVYV